MPRWCLRSSHLCLDFSYILSLGSLSAEVESTSTVFFDLLEGTQGYIRLLFVVRLKPLLGERRPMDPEYRAPRPVSKLLRKESGDRRPPAERKQAAQLASVVLATEGRPSWAAGCSTWTGQ